MDHLNDLPVLLELQLFLSENFPKEDELLRSGETDAAVLPRWCGHCRERSRSHRILRREHHTVRTSVLTNKQRMYQRAVKSAYHLCQYAFADVATVPVAMATASDAPRSYWSGSQPGSSPSHSNVRTPQHADTEVVSIRI
ncbi:hypothetical protein J6590_046300 [Homalodisca vitripennis]|nr:hypothetical protein J6590_046300 [Homalodisca vitripennis]